MDLTRQTFIFTSQHLYFYRDEPDHPYQDHFILSFFAYFFVFCKYSRKYKCGIRSHFKNSCRKKLNFQCPCGELNPRPCAYEPMIHSLDRISFKYAQASNSTGCIQLLAWPRQQFVLFPYFSLYLQLSPSSIKFGAHKVFCLTSPIQTSFGHKVQG